MKFPIAVSVRASNNVTLSVRVWIEMAFKLCFFFVVFGHPQCEGVD